MANPSDTNLVQVSGFAGPIPAPEVLKQYDTIVPGAADRNIRRHMPHSVVNHRRGWVDGLTHTNTIEGFWSLIKRAWYGSHHHYTKRFMPLFIAESCWKYNHRKDTNAFALFVRGRFA